MAQHRTIITMPDHWHSQHIPTPHATSKAIYYHSLRSPRCWVAPYGPPSTA